MMRDLWCPVRGFLSEAIRRIHTGQSVGALFNGR